MWKNEKFTLTKKLFVKTTLYKTVTFTKFLPKMREKIPCNFHTVYVDTVWKNENFSLTQKIIRQINSLVISLVIKTLLSRNFCQKCVRLNRSNFHIVHDNSRS